MRRVLRSWGKIGAIAGITLALYLAADIGFGLAFHRPVQVTPRDLRVQPAYRDEPYATLAFSREKAEMGANRPIFGTGLFTPAAHRGTFINVEPLPPTGLLYRRTVNPPPGKAPPVEVLFLGGSTLLGIDVPDDLTIASALSASLNAMDPAHDYQVVNAGVTGVDSTREADRLAYELGHGRKPQIVVVIDGGMDLFNGLYLGHPGQRPRPRGFLEEAFQAYFPLNIYRWLVNWMSARAIRSYQKVAPAHLGDEAEVKSLADRTIDAYLRNQEQMKAAAAADGARFLTVLQPSPYSTNYVRGAPDLAYVDDMTRRSWPGLAEVMRRFTPRLVEAVRELRGRGIDVLNLTAAFKDKTDSVFLDFGHYNAAGNRILGQRIAEALLQHQAAAP